MLNSSSRHAIRHAASTSRGSSRRILTRQQATLHLHHPHPHLALPVPAAAAALATTTATLALSLLRQSPASNDNLIMSSSPPLASSTLTPHSNTDNNKSLPARVMSLIRSLYNQLKALLRLTEMLAVTSPCLLTYPLVVRLCDRYPALYDRWWSLFVNAITYLGPASIKFMQWASARRDLFDANFCDRMASVQDSVKPHSWAETDGALKAALGEHYEEFLKLDKEVLGSGCIAQVYRGKLHTDTDTDTLPQDVAVKVVHPSIKRTIELDLNLFHSMAAALEMFPSFKYWSIGDALNEFAGLMEMQMDMEKEAQNLHRLRRNFKKNKHVIFPEPVDRLTSRDVLVEEFMEGESINKYIHMEEAMAPPGLRKKLAGLSLASFLQMLIADNFVHGDLHPGNIKLQHNLNGEPVLVFLDAGLCTELSLRSRKAFVQIFYHIVRGDGAKVAQAVLDTSPENDCQDPEGFVKAIAAIVTELQGGNQTHTHTHTTGIPTSSSASSSSSITNTSMEEQHTHKIVREQQQKKKNADAVGRVFETCRHFRVKLDGALSTIVISTFILEGLGRSLDKDLNIFRTALPLMLALPLAG